jgi:hypothetical protein
MTGWLWGALWSGMMRLLWVALWRSHARFTMWHAWSAMTAVLRGSQAFQPGCSNVLAAAATNVARTSLTPSRFGALRADYARWTLKLPYAGVHLADARGKEMPGSSRI